MHAEALDVAIKEEQARRGGNPETPDPPAPAKGRCIFIDDEAKASGNDLEGEEEDSSEEEEPEKGTKAADASDSEDEGQVCKLTMCT